jgi:glycosyltransferase involved in cell wall biosynthesis
MKVFPFSPYASIANYHLGLPGNGGGSVFSECVQTIRTQVELANPSHISLFPTLFPCQATAIGEIRRSVGRLVGVIQLVPSWKNPFGEVYWRQGLRALDSFEGDLVMGVFEDELILEYERLLESDKRLIHRFPTPYDGSGKLNSSETPFTVGLLGHQRREKRIDRLPYVVGALLDAGFSVILQDSSGQITASGTDQKLTVIGYVENLSTLIASCDVVVLDYDLESYRFNGSGIFAECLASGVPVIAPYGTSMSRLIDKYESGLRFVSSDIKSLLTQVHDVKNRQPEWVRKAQKAQTLFKRANSTALFVKAISHKIA